MKTGNSGTKKYFENIELIYFRLILFFILRTNNIFICVFFFFFFCFFFFISIYIHIYIYIYYFFFFFFKLNIK